MAQKVVNLYNKYMACWAYAGQYNPGALMAPIDPTGVKNFICALHCPLDNILLLRLAKTNIGDYLVKHGLLQVSGASVKIQQDNGKRNTWSNLDCSTAYYALQWFIRRIAMATWPSGCSAPCLSSSGILNPKEILKKIFPDSVSQSSKWWGAFDNCPSNLFDDSAKQIFDQQESNKFNSTELAEATKKNCPPKLIREKISPAQTTIINGDRQTIRITGNANTFWGLRHTCDQGQANGGNYWGCVYHSGILVIKEPTRGVLSAAGAAGVNPIAYPWIYGPPAGLNVAGYVAHRTFDNPADAFYFLALYFNLCACDQEAIDKLDEFGVNWILRCNLN
jgi:hypothetical protein